MPGPDPQSPSSGSGKSLRLCRSPAGAPSSRRRHRRRSPEPAPRSLPSARPLGRRRGAGWLARSFPSPRRPCLPAGLPAGRPAHPPAHPWWSRSLPASLPPACPPGAAAKGGAFGRPRPPGSSSRGSPPLTSPGSVSSSRGSSVPGSPSNIVAKMDNEVLGYKDLAALPKDKAILDIERPDLMIYEPHFTYSLLDHVERPRSRERSLSPKSLSPPPSPEVTRDWAENKSPGTASQAASRRTSSTSRSGVHHFHRPDINATETNIYKKPPIYKQREPTMTTTTTPPPPPSKHLIEDLIIESSKFPAAQPPDPNQPAKIETDYWPCPPSLAVVETEWRQRRMASKGREGEEEEDPSEESLRELQKQELSKVASNLGKLILKEEMEKSVPIRRKTRSLPDRTPFHSSLPVVGSSKSASLPAYGRSPLTRLQSTEFSPAGSEKGSPGLQVREPPAAGTTEPPGLAPRPAGRVGQWGGGSKGKERHVVVGGSWAKSPPSLV
ncbi:dematin isoform X3 [Pogona vitticeps]